MKNAISLFSGAGIGELLISDKIDVVLANEINKKRADLYNFFFPNTKMICGDIVSDNVQNNLKKIKKDIDLIIATPPCQGVSSLGKNKLQKSFLIDKRNFLVFMTFPLVHFYQPNFVLIENTERFSKMFFPYQGKFMLLKDILEIEFGNKYDIKVELLNCKDFDVPQSRPRVIIRLIKKGLNWALPKKSIEITLKDCIYNLPSLNPGEKSNLKWHYANDHKASIVDCLKYTPEGKSALQNNQHYPRNKDGEKIKGFHNTYKRLQWNKPCSTRTTYSGSLSSHNNVHPGRRLKNSLHSDPRVLTLLETFIVSTIPTDINFPSWATDSFIREVIGEGVPPLFIKKIIEKLIE